MNCSMRKRGFTLVELLVVIAIIAVLAAILFPVLTESKRRANMSKCVNNLHHLAMAVSMYADTNSGKMPNARVCIKKPSWEGSRGVSDRVVPQEGELFPFVKNDAIYLCPDDRKVKATQISDPYWSKNYPLSYSMNFKLSWLVMSTFRRPAKLLMFVHESRSRINDGDFRWEASDNMSKVHYDGTAVVYADGHALRQSYDRLWDARRAGEWEP